MLFQLRLDIMRNKVLWDWWNISLVQISESSVPSLNQRRELPLKWTLAMYCQSYDPPSLSVFITLQKMRNYSEWQDECDDLCLWMHTFQKLKLTFSSIQSWTESIRTHLCSTPGSNEPWLMSCLIFRTLPHKYIRHTILIKPGSITGNVLFHTVTRKNFMGAGWGKLSF